MIGPGFAAAAFAPFYLRALVVIIIMIIGAFTLGYVLG